MSAKTIASFLTAWMYRYHFALGIMVTCPVSVPPFRTQMPLRECLHKTIDHLRPGSSISLGEHGDLAGSLPQVTEESHQHWSSVSEWNRPHKTAGVLDFTFLANIAHCWRPIRATLCAQVCSPT
eukprot:5634263-Amphidinium_carterae.1